MKSAIRFDDSLPAFAHLIEAAWGDGALVANLFLRDASGKLTFVLIDDNHQKEARLDVALKASTELGAYVDGSGFSIATPEELFDETLRDSNRVRTVRLDHALFKGVVRIVDRRMVGADWLRRPEPTSPAPARLVFTSLKGGVGRSTALCVLASHLATHGRRVLAIDMDLEAPGLGNLLLPDGTLPEFGLLDYLVETQVGNTPDDQFFVDLVGPSWLGAGKGRVDVIPALGSRSLKSPANVLAKIARAYLAGSGKEGETITFTDYMRMFIDRFADPLRYDVVLIDARAGLHETAAAAIVGLGAEVFLFALDHAQAFAGYELLFAHLATISADSEDSLPSRLHIVQSKSPRDPRMRSGFAKRMEELFNRYLLKSDTLAAPTHVPSDLKDTFDVEWTEENREAVETLLHAEQAPPIISILDDDQFRSFDPVADRDALAESNYAPPFSEFLKTAEAILTSFDQPTNTEAPL
jgi:cellulose biosynthesis protein BcsQ